MEPVVQLIMQAGALGLLAYLIWWTTQTGAPALFSHLSGIQAAIQTSNTKLANVDARLGNVEHELKELRNEVQRAPTCTNFTRATSKDGDRAPGS